MDDTKRLDLMHKYGMVVFPQYERERDQLIEYWVVQYGLVYKTTVVGETPREAIDIAILDISANLQEH